MSDSSTHSAAVSGGSGAQPTPANNVNGGGNGSQGPLDDDGKVHLGLGHVPAPNARSTMGEVLGLQQQKTLAENKYMRRADAAEANVRPMSDHGEPTCASEDHTFMYHKAGGSDTLPGWGTMKNVFGSMSGDAS